MDGRTIAFLELLSQLIKPARCNCMIYAWNYLSTSSPTACRVPAVVCRVPAIILQCYGVLQNLSPVTLITAAPPAAPVQHFLHSITLSRNLSTCYPSCMNVNVKDLIWPMMMLSVSKWKVGLSFTFPQIITPSSLYFLPKLSILSSQFSQDYWKNLYEFIL